VVREVGDEGEGFGPDRVDDLGVEGAFAFEAIAFDKGEPVGVLLGECFAEDLGERAVELARDEVDAAIEELNAQGASARSDLEDAIVLPHSCVVDEFADHVVIREEVLPERFLWWVPGAFEEGADL
jgi:hypothetical protein